jgi:predicted nucleic acid-binding protein
MLESRALSGAVAQLGERRVRNAKVEGSIPFRSTTCYSSPAFRAAVRTQPTGWGSGPGRSTIFPLSNWRRSVRAFCAAFGLFHPAPIQFVTSKRAAARGRALRRAAICLVCRLCCFELLALLCRSVLAPWSSSEIRSPETAQSAARLRAAPKLKLADAVRAASALAFGADALVTHDRDLCALRDLRSSASRTKALQTNRLVISS